jgi:hypothetical protein
MVYGADKSQFKPGPASSFEARQSNNGVTIAAVAYDSEALARTAFGKVNPYEHGVLPVLVVIQNDARAALNLADMRAEYIEADGSRIDATPAKDVPYLRAPKRPNMNGTPLPGLGRSKKIRSRLRRLMNGPLRPKCSPPATPRTGSSISSRATGAAASSISPD